MEAVHASTDLAPPVPSYKGKVRDVYDLGDQMVLVSSDRLSAFDVVFGDTIPGKGKILNQISAHWFSLLKNVPHHFISEQADALPPQFQGTAFAGRSVLVKKTKRIDFECVVRAFLMGSGFKEYAASGTLAGEKLPVGLVKGQLLPAPAFTPAVKNDSGHDENISFAEMKKRLPAYADTLREKSLALFAFAFEKLKAKGIYILDTKFEFGILNDELLLIDEIFTPDSSRFVEIAEYEKAIAAGVEIPTMDKQIVRDYVESIGWDKNPPAPRLPAEVIQKTVAQYKKMEEVVLSL
ncbi:MAG: phosphoribosylaminoimidazolesuccinocarboxamide synthase [Spirochaetes bacterium]|nr:phosphoribosylaminoimidazolesuccinocarboxamide synthase [Spirochaetota bacterium]MBX3724096.1 phosphoribosylaminoimidazolesuccinocarboxamide synthase [Turneriella sp.]